VHKCAVTQSSVARFATRGAVKQSVRRAEITVPNCRRTVRTRASNKKVVVARGAEMPRSTSQHGSNGVGSVVNKPVSNASSECAEGQ